MTQREAVLNVLKSGESISSFEAFQEFGITRLSAIVFDLRKRGYAISGKDEEITNRFGNKVHFTRYKLEDAC